MAGGDDIVETDEQLFARARAHMEKYWGAASLDRRLWDATVRLVLRASPSEADGEGWIAVSERMPQSSKNVLFWCGWLQLGYHLDVTDNWYGRGDEGFAIREKVTHWMPLPDAPGRSEEKGNG
jgi:hypothetical protein